jgi:DNA mismatch repair protein MutS2
MNRHAFRTLEFDAVRRWLATYAGSDGGRQRLSALEPLRAPADVREALATTSEARRALESLGQQPYHDLPEVAAMLPKASWRGFALEPRELLDVASFAEGATEIGRSLRGADVAPRIARRAQRLADFQVLSQRLRRALLPSGEVADDASPRLAEIRRALGRLKSQLQSMMESFVRDKDADRLLQEKLVTTRNERYVLILKADQRGQVPGIVHGRSGSGASVFVEPLPAVELNNDIVSLQDDERAEVKRILEELTAAVGERHAELSAAADVLGELDALQAAARASVDVDGIEPVIAGELRLNLRRARHPMLLGVVTDRLGQPPRSSREAVPIDVALEPSAPVLVISGPNTGGKTVALKTVGLFALMAQCGLHVPAAEGSTLPVFRRVYADIGDDQSIAESLSTFSAHLTAIREMTRDLERPALVLLDEVGAGTDPTEGGALGVAVVDYFRRHGAMVLTTTHHGLMKAYSQSTPGVASASFGYEPETFAPTYQLRLGQPGRSLALEMTERLGLPAELVSDARARLSDKEAQAEALLRKLEGEQEAIAERERRVAAQEKLLREALEAQRAAAREAEAERERARQTFAADLRRRSDELARKAADAVKDAVQRLETSRRAAANEGSRARSHAVEAIRGARDEALESVGVATAEATPTSRREPLRGDRVRVTDLGIVADVIEVHADGELELAIGGKRMRAPRQAVTVIEGARPQGRTNAPMPAGRGTGSDTSAEINIVGLRVDEAMPRVDKMLDQAALADHREVRIVHGFGQGRLRQAVAEMLEGHPHVASFRPGGPREGGGGVTVVELKE